MAGRGVRGGVLAWLVLAGSLACVPTALAGEITEDTASGTLFFTAAAGEVNDVEGSVFNFETLSLGDRIPIGDAAPSCRRAREDDVSCELKDDARERVFGRIVIDLGDGNDATRMAGGRWDQFVLATTQVGGAGDDTLRGGNATNSLSGGEGDDELVGGHTPSSTPVFDVSRTDMNGGPGADRFVPDNHLDIVDYSEHTSPITVTFDGIADDGTANEGDNVLPLIDGAIGGAAADRLVGGKHNERLDGREGNDVLQGNTGRDELTGGGGDDALLARDGEPDRVDCGEGTDRAVVDQYDEILGCERIDRGSNGDPRIVFVRVDFPSKLALGPSLKGTITAASELNGPEVTYYYGHARFGVGTSRPGFALRRTVVKTRIAGTAGERGPFEVRLGQRRLASIRRAARRAGRRTVLLHLVLRAELPDPERRAAKLNVFFRVRVR